MPLNKPQVSGLIAIIIGCALTMGGAMMLLVTLIEPRANPFFLPAMVQIMLGILGVIAGILFWRQSTTAKYLVAFVAAAVAANVIFMLTIFARVIAD